MNGRSLSEAFVLHCTGNGRAVIKKRDPVDEREREMRYEQIEAMML